MRADDEAYVVSTWTLSAWPSRGRKETQQRRAMRDAHRATVRALLAHARVVVACAPEHDATLHGWAAAHDGRVVFVYVPRPVASAGPEIREALERAVLM